MLDNITKTETTRARIYLIGGIALAVLGVILSLAMIASVVFLCLTLGGVMVLPTAVTVILLVVSSTTLLIGLIGLISTGACLWPGWMGGCGGGGGGGAAMIGCAILVMIVIVGAVSPAICGICLLCAACGHFKNRQKIIEERRIQKLLYEMKSDLLWQDSDAYVIAYLTLATGLDPEMIQNLRWNQIRNDGEAIMLKTKTHNKMEIDCDLQIPLEPGKKFLVKGNDEGPVFTKERFEISYYAFINWMQCHHFDTPIAVNHIREDKGRFRWTRETVNFSSINIPQNTNLPAGQCDARFYHTINHTLRYQDPSAFIIFLLVFCYGLRVKEIESLQCDMIDLSQEQGQITVPGNSKRTVLIHKKHTNILKKIWKLGTGTSPVFPGSALKKSRSTLAKFLEVNGYSREYDREMSCEVLEDGPNSSTPTEKPFKPDFSFLKSNAPQSQSH